MSNKIGGAPIKTGDDFIAEIESMDLSSLKDHSYLVGISQGERSGPKMITSSIRGPYTFVEMCEEVGMMWKEHQHHAKVMIPVKDRTKAPKYLDENTTDYIECHYMDIITEAMLDGIFDAEKEYTCSANIIDGDVSEDPRQATEETKEEDQ